MAGRWAYAAGTVDALLEADAGPEQVTKEMAGIALGFGVGMGSLTDISYGDDFERARDEVMRRVRRADHEATSTHGYVPRIRRFLTNVEDALLETNRTDEAATLRSLLRQDVLDLESVRALARDLPNEEALGNAGRAALASLRAELA